uniref:Glycerophosphocholine acyltransferase 1 n=1 Tax=Eutreptiella gymnastica TaxID=73025 RepID=A0A7S4CFW0_9EUGL
MASLYIHMSPAVMSWTFRWYTDRILQAYGGERFSLPGLTEEVAASVTVFDIVLPGAMVYLAWMVPYTLWLLICGIHHSPTTTGKETSWNDLCTQKKSPLPMLLCLGRQDPAELVADRLRALQYNLTQFAFSAVAMSLSALMWHSFTLHTAFLLCIILYAIYVGSAKIHRSMMRWYLRPFGVLEEVKRRALEQKRE